VSAEGASPRKPPFGRVLLKLSGEVLAGEAGFGIDFDVVRALAEEIGQVVDSGVQVALVVGGGNIIRGQEAARHGVERVVGDNMGMLATVINALALQSAFEGLGYQTRVLTAIEMRQVAELFIRRRAIRHLEKGRIVIFAAGTGNPYFSTDTAAALRAAEIGADCLLKGTKVDGVFEEDPRRNPRAPFIKDLCYKDALVKELKVMDSPAFALCMENRIPVIVFNVLVPGNIRRILVDGERIGTWVGF